jgi:hypothetical protein
MEKRKNDMVITIKDVQAAMTYGEPIEENFTIAGVGVQVWHDQDTENPYHWGDGMAPALWFSYRIESYGQGDLEDPIGRMSPAFVSRHYRKIEAILDNVDSEEPARIKADYGGDMGDIRQEYYAECLADLRSEYWGSVCDYFETLAELWRLQGIPADTFQRNGYSQGHSARGLIVHLPEWVQAVGASHASPDEIEKDMESDADTYGAWLWGDVYGFTVGNDSDDEDAECCGGYYGTDSDYFAACIADAVNSVLEARANVAAACIQAERPDLAPCYA